VLRPGIESIIERDSNCCMLARPAVRYVPDTPVSTC
jgi:hypothetical protein